jgi:putative transposase
MSLRDVVDAIFYILRTGCPWRFLPKDFPPKSTAWVYAGNKYHNHALYGWLAENGSYELATVRRPKGAEGWVRLPMSWTVERTFAWLNKCRRLSVDREKSTRSAEAMIRLAMIHVVLNRLCPKEGQPEFQYRRAG